MLEEDHFQILSTLDDICNGRKDLTGDTKFMLEILRNTNTIEDALLLISRKLKLMHKIFSDIRHSNMELGYFAIPYLRNLDFLEIK